MDLNTIVATSKASQDKRELLELLIQLQKITPHFILEIGVHCGYLLETWGKAFPEAALIGIENEASSLDPKATENAVVVTLDSHAPEALKQVEALIDRFPVDFLFIDGDHTYEGVKQDFGMYAPLVRKGGIIALHDAALRDNPEVEVYRFWEEIRQDRNTLLITGKPNGTGTGIIFV